MLMTDVNVGTGAGAGGSTGAAVSTAAAGAGVDLTVLVGRFAVRFFATVFVAVRLSFLVAATAGPAVAGTTATARASAARPVRSGVITTLLSAPRRLG